MKKILLFLSISMSVQQADAQAFEKENIKPMEIHIREGLALMNGTSAMSGIGMLNVIYAENLVNWSLLASSINAGAT
jgi:histidine ammonia-lyase